jgi:lysophospholipase
MLAITRINRPRLTRAFALGLLLAGLARRYVPGGGATSIMTKPFEGNPLTSDARRYGRNARVAEAFPRLAIGDPTIRWLSAALAQILRFETPRYALDIRTPLLIVAAAKDEVVSTPVIEAFSARCKTGPALLIAGARHEILQERDEIRGSFFAAFDAFVPGSR